MTRAHFWNIIDSTTRGIGADRKPQIKRLERALAQYKPKDLESFHRHLHANLASAATPRLLIATFAVFGQLTDRLFLEFRAWILLHGSKTFATVIKDSDSIATLLTRKQVDQTDIGEFLSLAPTLWLQKTGNADEWDNTFSLPSCPSIKAAWPKDKRAFEKRYPVLFKAFWDQTRINAYNAPPSHGAPRNKRGTKLTRATNPVRAMAPSRFWKIIDSTRPGVGPNRQLQVDSIATLLGNLTPDASASFQKQLNRQLTLAYTFPLMAAAFLVLGYLSDDSFLDFRAWLLLNGSRAFAAALKNPDTITKLIRPNQVDDLHSAAFPELPLKLWLQTIDDEELFFRKAGHLHDPDIPMPWPANAREFKARFPVLFEAYENPKRIKLLLAR